MQIHNFNTQHELVHSMVFEVKEILQAAVAQNGQAFLVVSGGKTPIDFFKHLAQTDLPWDKITITLADERCVATSDAHSNAKLVKEFLLQHKAQLATFIHLYSEEASFLEVEEKIKSLPTFDVIILGMGEDGHTASLFPDADELSSAMAEDAPAIIHITPLSAPFKRITLTKRRLLNTKHMYLHLVGTKKLAVMQTALKDTESTIMPISTFLHHKNPCLQVMYAP